MLTIKIDKYEVLIGTPEFTKGQRIFQLDFNEDLSELTDFCRPVYELAGVPIVYNQMVWRERNGEPRRVHFSKTQYDQQIELFWTKEDCEKYIENSIEKQNKLALSQNRSNLMKELIDYSKVLENIEKLSIAEVRSITKNIINCVKNLENYE